MNEHARPTVVSVGYQLRDLDELVQLLQAEAVDVLVDVRLSARSRKPGLSKSALAEGLADAGIAYRHEPTLGNPPENREPFQDGDAAARTLMADKLRDEGADAVAALAELADEQTVALLCYERDHDICHRSAVVDALRAHRPDLTVIEL